MKTSRLTLVVAAWLGGCLLAAGAATPAVAQSNAHAQALLGDRFNLSLGTFLVGTDVKGSLNGRSVNNPEIDFGKDFGLDNDAARVRFDGLWRITPAHHLRFMYFDTRNDGTRTLDKTIKWGDYTFNVGGNVTAESRLRIFELAYEYAFAKQTTYEVAGTIGLHYIDTQLRLSGSASFTDANGNVSALQATTRENSVPAPLPVIGLRGAWAVSPQWLIDAQAQFFKAKLQGIDGTITDARVVATWMFHRNFGVGLGYNYFGTDLDVQKNSFDGSLNLGYSGAQLFVTGSF